MGATAAKAAAHQPMWIETLNVNEDGEPITESLYLDWMEDPVEFSSNAKAQVSKSAGERLIRDINSIVEAGDDEPETKEEEDDTE